MTGGEGQRRIWYVAVRHFHMSIAEWDALPWHQQRALLEGWELEANPDGPRKNDDGVVESVTTSREGNQVRTDTSQEFDFSSDPVAMLAAFKAGA